MQGPCVMDDGGEMQMPLNGARWDASSHYSSEFAKRQPHAMPHGVADFRTASPRYVAPGTTPTSAAGGGLAGADSEYVSEYKAHSLQVRAAPCSIVGCGRRGANA